MAEQIIVVGGGLAGLSTAHTVLEHGGRVLLLDKCPFLGGNSTKATSGINGALTRTQAAKGIDDSADKFEQDILKGAAGVGHTTPPTHTVPLAKVRLLPFHFLSLPPIQLFLSFSLRRARFVFLGLTRTMRVRVGSAPSGRENGGGRSPQSSLLVCSQRSRSFADETCSSRSATRLFFLAAVAW